MNKLDKDSENVKNMGTWSSFFKVKSESVFSQVELTVYIN